MRGDGGVAALLRGARKEPSDEGSFGVVDPFVEISHHVVDRIAAPFAATVRCFARSSEQRAAMVLGEVQSGVEMMNARIAVQERRRVRFAEHVAATWFVLLPVGELLRSLAPARQDPLVAS